MNQIDFSSDFDDLESDNVESDEERGEGNDDKISEEDEQDGGRHEETWAADG